jgi:hypothetical protein
MSRSTRGLIQKSLISQIDKIRIDFWKTLRTIGIAGIIVSVIKRGISPVEKGKRFQKYSQSYLDQIRGKVRFFTADSGAVIPVEGKFETGMGVGKKRSPVSMNLSGKMLSSLTWRSSKGILEAKDEKWNWHNDGVPENNLPERRLLPNRKGERFNRLIQAKITDALASATGRKTREIKKLVSINFKFK